MTRRITLFIILAFGFSWSFWGMNVLLVRSSGNFSSTLHFAGAFGPLAGAWLTAFLTGGKSGLRRYMKRVYGRFTGPFLVIAIVLPVLFFLVGLAVDAVWNGFSTVWPWFDNDKLPHWSPIFLWLAWVVTYGLGEESGWRGYLLPELAEHMPARPATLVVALVWALWHTPIFFYDPDFQGMSLLMATGWIVGLTFGSFFLGWLTVQADYSIWPAILFHGTFNFLSAGDAVPSLVTAISSALLIALVLVLARRYNERFQKIEMGD